MRLIDADFMKTRIEVDNNSKYRGFDSILKEWIDAQPTVTAIPFEYIERVWGKITLHDQELLYETVCEYIKENGESNRLMEE